MTKEPEQSLSNEGQNPSQQDVKHRRAKLIVALTDRDSMLHHFSAPFVKEAQKPNHFEDLQAEKERLKSGPIHLTEDELEFYASWNLGQKLLAHLTPPSPRRPTTPKAKPQLSETDLRPVDHTVRKVIEGIVGGGVIPSIEMIMTTADLSRDQARRSMDRLRAADTIKPLDKIAEDIKLARLREVVGRLRETYPKGVINPSVIAQKIGASKRWVNKNLIRVLI